MGGIKKVIVECKPDELLAKSLGLNRKEIVHQSSKGEVCNHLMKSEISLAIIDEDPNSSQPKHLDKLTKIEEKFDVRYLQLKSENKTILVLKPRLEEWILKRCKESNIDIKKYHLPSNNKALKDVINYHLPYFEKLLNELKKKDEGFYYLKDRLDSVCFEEKQADTHLLKKAIKKK